MKTMKNKNATNQKYTSFTRLFLVLCMTLISTVPFAQLITIGNGTSTAGAPISRFFRYHTSEMIYLQSEINTQGSISSVAFYKASGSDANPIQDVSIYMKHTTQSTLSSGTTSTDGYTLVFSGNYTNTAGMGWMTVNLDQAFAYNNTDNLQILIIKGNQAPLLSAQFPRYENTSTSPDYRIRSYNDDSNPWSETRTMTVSFSRPNIRLNLQNCTPTASTLTETACGSFSLNNETYTNSGTYTQTLQNTLGCDSIVTLNLTVLQTSSSSLTESACTSFELNGEIYTETGTYTQTLQNTLGCDSIITLNLTVSEPSFVTITETACTSYELNGEIYTSSGTFTQTLTNQAGCDSTITLNLTIQESVSNSITETACDSFTWNDETYTSSGAYSQEFTTVSGCDSIVTLNLTITTLNPAVTVTGNTLSATQSGATYQWKDCVTGQNVLGATSQTFTPTQNGSYAVIISLSSCTVESDCEEITTLNTENLIVANATVYPNPFKDLITIVWVKGTPANGSIIDIQGKEILSFSLENKVELDLSFLPNGMYILQLESEGKIEHHRLIK
jgi:hypothetical protein